LAQRQRHMFLSNVGMFLPVGMAKHPFFIRTAVRTSNLANYDTLRGLASVEFYILLRVLAVISKELYLRRDNHLIWFDLIWYTVFLSRAPDSRVLGKEMISPLIFLTESRGQFDDIPNSFSGGLQFETRGYFREIVVVLRAVFNFLSRGPVWTT
jgi:hypothetical protein